MDWLRRAAEFLWPNWEKVMIFAFLSLAGFLFLFWSFDITRILLSLAVIYFYSCRLWQKLDKKEVKTAKDIFVDFLSFFAFVLFVVLAMELVIKV